MLMNPTKVGHEFASTHSMATLRTISANLFENLSLQSSGKDVEPIPEDELMLIEENIQRSMKLVAKLRNTFRSIHRLPALALALIFNLLQNHEESPSSENGPPDSWILVTRVCSHWRAVATQTPSLWRSIYIGNNPRHIQTFLKNSSSERLRLFFSLPTSSGEDSFSTPLHFSTLRSAFTLIVDNLDRIEELIFSRAFPIDEILHKDVFARFIKSSLSTNNPYKNIPLLHSSEKPSSAIFRLFLTPAPQMHKICLYGPLVEHFLTSPVQYTNLTHLELYNQPKWQEDHIAHGIHMDEFLDILEASSHCLQLLILVRAGPRVQNRLNSQAKKLREVISLPALKSLEIGEWPSSGHIAHFLAHLRIPGKTERCVWGKDLRCLSSILFPLDVEMSQSHEKGWDTDIRRLVLTCASDGDMVCIKDQTVFIQGSMDFLTIYPLFRDQPQIFRRVEELCLTPVPEETIPSQEEYRCLFEAMPNIRRLILRDIDVAPIYHALGLFDNMDVKSPEVGCNLPLLKLQDLDIQYTDSFPKLVQDTFGRRYTTCVTSAVLGLLSFVQRRLKIDRPIRYIRFCTGGLRDEVGLSRPPHEWGWSVMVVQIKSVVERMDFTVRSWPEETKEGELVAGVLEGVWPSRGYLAIHK